MVRNVSFEGRGFVMNLQGYNISTMGSRFSIIFDHHNKIIKHGVLGMFLETTSKLVCGIKSEKGNCYLPFSSLENNFQIIYMKTTQNSVTYSGVCKDYGYNMDITFTSPFIPQDEKTYTAPFIYVDVKITNSTRPHNLIRVKDNIQKGQFVFGLDNPNISFLQDDNHLDMNYDINADASFVLGDFARTLKVNIHKDGERMELINCTETLYSANMSLGSDNLFYGEIDFTKQESFEFSLVWSGFKGDDFIRAFGENATFLYTEYFSSNKEVIKFATDEKSTIIKKSKFYDDVFENSSLSQTWKDFIAQTFQSYKLNTMYIKTISGKKSFTVWEGNCMYNSTMDVEYNNGLFYYTIFPEVLEHMLDYWELSENDTGHISHDLGRGFAYGGKTQYPHPMKVEENTNYILMLFAYYKIFGKEEILTRHIDILKKITNFMLEADTTGNGIPNEGTSNTIDDAIPAIQHAKEQTYLAIKTACSLQIMAEICKILNDNEYAHVVTARSEKIINTVDSQLWKDDHYTVCLDTRQDGYTRFMTREELHGEMDGRDEHSIFAENGMLYPNMAGFELAGFNMEKFNKNIFNSYLKCDTMYGCNHSENSDSIWISQNLWRDFTAAYMGFDFLDNVEKYMEFQKVMNTDGRLNLFIDTFGENALWYYPRGLTSIGVLYAALALKIDGINKTIQLSPLRKTMRIPLVALANWETMEMPVVVVNQGKVTFENKHLLQDYKIIIK